MTNNTEPVNTKDMQYHPFRVCWWLRIKILLQSRCPQSHRHITRKIQNNTRLGRLPILRNVPKIELLHRMGGHSHARIRHPRTKKIQPPSSIKTPTCPTSLGNTSLRIVPSSNPQGDLQSPYPWQGQYPTCLVHHRNIPLLRMCRIPLHITIL